LIERTCRYAKDLVTGLGRLPNVEVLWRPTINQGLVRFLDPRAGVAEADHDRRTEEVVQGIAETGEAFFAATTWRPRPMCALGRRDINSLVDNGLCDPYNHLKP
jgi:hypothetical protein